MKKFLYTAFILMVVSSICYLKTKALAYQYIITRHDQPTPENPIPKEAEIAVAYTISKEGGLTAIVYNRTSEIMTIDQTKSFFVNSDGRSTSYYDPTVRTTSTTDMSSSTKGASVNLGSIAGALGIGGVVGQIANGVNVGGSGTNGTATTNATYVADLPQVSIAPYGNGAMSKVFPIKGVGAEALKQTPNNNSLISLTEEQSDCKFSVCITYSLDEGKTYKKLITNFYTNSNVAVPVASERTVNESLRNLYSIKPDAVNAPLWLLYFKIKAKYDFTKSISNYLGNSQGILYDYN